ncbi:ParB/RepB/Spo0J family partition protein [Vallicoccus soli]|uniref:ParB/RepB/Spo0J family partition protein n=1 Tax=Vallicoccus soli TaxID=2339232 RepID=A0A3A3YVA4_9ACTN|nr:ParB/RepB/Spo0J family partition protein [Vallicoccus soli]RJK94154.1 ParB/RepB/Spo0J family partition protein [Vallicoccus soli]
MSDRRRGLGRGLGALLPSGPVVPGGDTRGTAFATTSPVDVFFRERDGIAAVGHPTTPLPEDRADRPSEDGAPPALEHPTTGHGQTGQPAPADDGSDHEAQPAEVPAARRPDVATEGTDGGALPGDLDEEPRLIGGAYYAEVPLDRIRPNPRQPREVFDEEALAELVASLKEVGLLQPVVVRPVGDGYELVVGERRWRAAQEAGFESIPALVRETGDQDLLRDALLENLHRSQLNPLEEAAAYGQLLEDFGCTHDELARRIGRSRPQISNTLRLLRLPPLVQRRVAAGVLTAGHARALLAVEDGPAQERLAQRIVAEGLSVRAVEEIAALGETGGDPVVRAPRRARAAAPGLDELAGRLADRFETRVKVDLGKSKGKIVVEFASLEDLERIVALMSPGAGLGDVQNPGQQDQQPAEPGAA